MFVAISYVCSDLSIVRRLSFAAATLPTEILHNTGTCTKFGFRSHTATAPSSKVQLLLENRVFGPQCFRC